MLRSIFMLGLLLALIPVRPARAVFHLGRIGEVMAGVGADPSVQYVEIRMNTGFQNAVANARITAFNCDGTTATVLLVVPGNVTNQGAGVTWIVGSQSFAAAAGITPDFTWDTTTAGSIPTACGMVCYGAPGIVPPNPSTWSASDPNQYVDCVAYGNYTGPTKTSTHDGTPISGTPTALSAGDGVHGLTRSADTGNNTADFILACPTPTNNAGGVGSFGACTPPSTTTTTVTSATTTTTAPATKSKCTARELSAAGKKALAKTKCLAKAVAKGEAVGSGCLMIAEAKFSAAFGKATTAGDCRTPTTAGTIEDKVDGFVNDLDTTLVNGSGAASKCTSKELAAAGKKAAAKLTCQAKAVGKNETVGLSSCLAAAAARFSTAYGKATAPGHCITSTDAMTVGGKVDTFVNDVTSTLAP